jgi:hypothetical protein
VKLTKLKALTEVNNVDPVQHARAKAFDASDKLFFNFAHALNTGEDSILKKLVRDGMVPVTQIKPVEVAMAELGHALIALQKSVMNPKKKDEEK